MIFCEAWRYRPMPQIFNQEMLKDISVVFLTGISDPAHIKAVLNLKPQGYLLKPASKRSLISTISKTIKT